MVAPPVTGPGIPDLARQGLILAARNVRLAANFGSVIMLLVFPLVFLYGFLALFGILLRGRDSTTRST